MNITSMFNVSSIYNLAWIAVNLGVAIFIAVIFFGYGVKEVTKEEYEEFIDQAKKDK